tara:strand:+ start:77 stop:331 length:255 start_codon:yes stop_codon:yes gene_type:complete
VGNPYLYAFRRFGPGVSEEWMAWPVGPQKRAQLFLRVLGNVTKLAKAQGKGKGSDRRQPSLDELSGRFHVGVWSQKANPDRAWR